MVLGLDPISLIEMDTEKWLSKDQTKLYYIYKINHLK